MGTADLYGSNDPFQVCNLSLFILFTHLPSLPIKRSRIVYFRPFTMLWPQRMPRSPKPLANSPKAEDFIVKVDFWVASTCQMFDQPVLRSKISKPISWLLFVPVKIGLVMKGNRSTSTRLHRRLLLKYRLSHLIKFLSKYSSTLILQFLMKRGLSSTKRFSSDRHQPRWILGITAKWVPGPRRRRRTEARRRRGKMRMWKSPRQPPRSPK